MSNNSDKRPTVSVIIPTYNRKEELRRAIESVLVQENVSLEVLICDDGSTDGTIEMVSSWADARVRLLTGPRGGRPAIPRNRGIKAAQGEWLAFLDDDDEWLPEKLQTQLKFAEEKGYLAITTNALRIKPGQEDSLLFHTCNIPEHLSFDVLLSVNYAITSSVIVHHSLFERVEGFPECKNLIGREDYALWLRIASITPFGYIREPYVLYTDMPTQSIRRQGGSERKALSWVYSDYLIWAKLPIFSRNRLLTIMRKYQHLLLYEKIIRKIKRRFNKI